MNRGVVLLCFASFPMLASAVGSETWMPHYISCDGYSDGYREAGCWGKAVCVNGQPQVTQCAIDQMYDFDSDSCVSRSQQLASTACNQQIDCSQRSSGRYADPSDGCRSYFICMQGAFFGHMYCPPRTIFTKPSKCATIPVTPLHPVARTWHPTPPPLMPLTPISPLWRTQSCLS